MRWAGYVARVGAMETAYRILVTKPEGKRSLGRLLRRCEDNIRMDLTIIRWEGVNGMCLTYDRDQ
jgi:hypothetical protein